MVTIRTCKVFSHALGEYLRQADYYSQGMKVKGRSFGQLCAKVGLVEDAAISDEAFERIASNHHAATGEQLTERMAAARRAGYDATFNAPKSVSIQAFIGGDARLLAAHETAVAEALRELETFACHQAGRGINKRYVTSGQIAAAVFRHGESRALDPHLHSHAFVFNVTQDSADPRLLALESSNIFERTRYLTEVYRNALAREVRNLGYAIERREHGFELVGVSRELLDRFSKRAHERDIAIAAREAELGRELTRDEVAILVRENRAKKHYELTPEDVRQRQVAQVGERELAQLHALAKPAASLHAAESVPLATAVERATDHVFERKTVVPLHEFTAEVIRQSYGQHGLPDIKQAVASGPGALLHANGHVSTPAALELERALVGRINAGVGACTELGFLRREAMDRLSPEQRAAVKTILSSCDRVVAFRGKAGTGKTYALASAIEGMAAIGREVACFAPSTQAVEILRRDGSEQSRDGRPAAGEALSRAETVQRLLVDPAQQAAIAGKVVVVDEYGLLSTRQLQALVDLVEKLRARLLLVGDSTQHTSVEAGDGARIVEKESRVTVAELRTIKRQSANPAYLAAAQNLAAGRMAAGLKKLDAMGAIVEVENPTDRRVRMVADWHAATQQTKSVRTKAGLQIRAMTALMVAPTWDEIDALNTHARVKLRTAGQITGADQPFLSLRAKDWTKAQHKDVRQYRPGDVLVAHKATKHFARGDELRVVRRDHRRLIVACGTREFSVSPRQSGLAWTACEERPLAVAFGDRIRLRAIGRAQSPEGSQRRLANGATAIVRSVDADGRLMLADGSTLHSRQVVHGYATTSHAAQGFTVDHVFIAGAVSREGLYVSATRGREGIRIFVPDREAFLDTAGLKSEARMSALEFLRANDALLPPGLPDWMQPLRRSLRYLALVRQRTTPGYESSGAPPRPAPAAQHRQSARIGV